MSQIRHRITILNHDPNHDNIISSFNSTGVLELNPSAKYTREDKFTIPFNNKFKYIRQLRISIGHVDSDVFHYNSNGLTIYVVPNTTNKDLFFNEINNFVSKLFDIRMSKSNWILSKNTLLFNTKNFAKDNINMVLAGLSNYPHIDTEVFDFYYENNRLIFSFINKDTAHPIERNDQIYQETGIFLVDENSTSDDIILSGVRVLFPEEEPMKKTLFHIKPKHRDLASSSEVVENGLHPKLKTTLQKSSIPKDGDIKDCKLYYYMALNKNLFVDRHNLGEGFDFIFNFGNKDLELPEYKIGEWGNELLLEYKDWEQKFNNNEELEMTLNLHSRYQVPGMGSAENDQKLVSIHQPVVFFGCDEASDRPTVGYNPFINDYPIGNKYLQYFTNDTIFYTSFNTTELEVSIPIPNKKFELVNLITSLTLLIGILIIFLQILNTKINGKKTI